MRCLATLAIAALTFGGCVQDPSPNPVGHYTSRIAAPAPIPEKYDPVVPTLDLNDPNNLSDSAGQTKFPLDQPLSLEQAEALALRTSPRIAEAQGVAAVAATREQVALATFLPTVSANYSFQGFNNNVGFAGTLPGGRFPILPIRGYGPGVQDFEVLDLRVQWTVLQFGKRLALHDQAEMRDEIARWQLERTRQAVTFDVALNYAQVLQARATEVVADRAVVRAEATLRDVKNLAENGVLTGEDVLRAEVFLADVRQALISATSEAQIAVAGLNRAIGINVSLPTRVFERTPELDEYPVTLEECLARAIDGRPEFSIVRLGVAAAGRGEDAARADFLPTITTSGGGAIVQGSGVQNAQIADAGIFLNWNLSKGGGVRRRCEGRMQKSRSRSPRVSRCATRLPTRRTSPTATSKTQSAGSSNLDLPSSRPRRRCDLSAIGITGATPNRPTLSTPRRRSSEPNKT